MLVAPHHDNLAICCHRHNDSEIRQHDAVKVIDDSFTGELDLFAINTQPGHGAQHQLLPENFPRLDNRYVLSGHRLSFAGRVAASGTNSKRLRASLARTWPRR